ncbi:hypothetical protein [Brevundimonas bacteroides]|uniref:hypothetical protein n=1 Tax=Brevundimonas bacteroides TaxID=74311 RepID=UPI000496F960|nr:hypothetical protein [Brevundimonas bacteroides]
MDLAQPRRLTLDTSHWANLIRDAVSPSSAMRDKARSFPDRLLDQGYVLTLAFHHLEELLNHDKEDLAEARLAYMLDLPFIAWLRSARAPHGPGAITDIMAAEAVAQCEGASSLTAVRDRVRPDLFRYGAAREALGDPDLWRQLRPLLRASARRARTIAAIAPMTFGNGQAPLSALISSRFRTPEDSHRTLAAMQAAMGQEIASKGDGRIQRPHEIAAEFFNDVADMRPWEETDIWEFIVRTSEARGVRREELRLDMTNDELGDLCVFRSQLAVIAEATGRPFEVLRGTVTMEHCPHWVLTKALDRSRQEGLRRPGSDVNDGYLAALAPYVDRLYVDKRRLENFRRATPGMLELRGLLCDVVRAAHYWEIPNQLNTLKGA